MLYSNPFIEFLEKKDPDSIALFQGKENINTGTLLADSKHLAFQLSQKGMKENDRIILVAQPGIDFLKIIFATMLLKTQVAIIDPEMGRENYLQKLKQFQPQWAFIDSRLLLLQEHPILRALYFFFKKNGFYFPRQSNLKTISTGPWLPLFQTHLKLGALLKNKSRHLTEIAAGNPHHEYIITYTSGTNSAPKGVVHTFQTLANSIDIIVNLIQSDQKQILATHLPHFMLISILAGIPVKIWQGEMIASKRLLFLDQHQITTFFGPPAEYLDLIQECQKQGRRLPNCLQHVLLGSAPVHVSFLEKFSSFLPKHTKITCLYGMTENLVVATIDGKEKLKYACSGDLLGTPVKNVEISIAEDGEILLHSDQLFSRYWDQKKEATKHPTGDLGFLDSNGKLILSGRKKDMIIRRNFNLYPALYESTIEKIEGISRAVFIGVYREELADEKVYLLIEGAPFLKADQIKSQLQKGSYCIDKEAWPDEIILRTIPRKGRQQKVDRHGLRKEISAL